MSILEADELYAHRPVVLPTAPSRRRRVRHGLAHEASVWRDEESGLVLWACRACPEGGEAPTTIEASRQAGRHEREASHDGP